MMEDRKNEDTRHEVARDLFRDVEDGDQQDDFSEFIWNEIEAGVNPTVNSAEACRSALLRQSPDRECAICLEDIEDKGVADSCFHSFCFPCLLKWSKVKAECPLCKQPFKSILHNIRTIDDYDQYHISPKNVGMLWRESPGFTSEFWIGRPNNYQRIEDSFESVAYEMIRASRLITYPRERNVLSENLSTISFRRHVYENRLWVKPFRYDSVQHHRINFAEFYRRHPQYVSQLRPWLNRELFALLCDRLNQVPLVLDLILSLVTRHDMRSEEFFFQVVPYFQHRTSHFVHEFFNFASSLYEMDRYDHCTIYENLVSESGRSAMPCTTRSDVNPVTSSAITFSENGPSVCIIYTSGSSCLSGRNMTGSFERQLECSSRSVNDNIWHSVFPVTSESLQRTSEYPSSSFQRFPDCKVFPGPSTSGVQTAAEEGHGKSFPDESASSASIPADDDSDCSVVTIFPPELIDLVSSSSEDENVCSSTVHRNYMTTQTEESSGCSFSEKELEGLEATRTNGDSSDNVFPSSSSANCRSLTPGPQFFGSPSLLIESISSPVPGNHRSITTGPQFFGSPSPPVGSISPYMPANCRSLTPGPQFLSPLSPHSESISPPMPVLTNQINTETDDTINGSNCIENSKLLSTCQGIMDSSSLLCNDRVASHFSFGTNSSATVCNSVKTYGARKWLSSCSGNYLPASFSLSINQTSKKSYSDIATNSSIDQVPGLRLNDESQSSVQGRENNQKECYERWQHHSQSAEGSGKESGMFKGSGTKRKLCSIVCVKPNSDHQSSHSGHSSNCHKRHKKKQKKRKHSQHHKCPHRSGSCSHHSQNSKRLKDRKKKKHNSLKHCFHSQEMSSQSDD